MYLIKRGSIYYVEYLDENSKLRRKSTRTSNPSEANKFLENFNKSTTDDNHSLSDDGIYQIDLNTFNSQYEQYCERAHSKKYTIQVKSILGQLSNVYGKYNLSDLRPRLLEEYLLKKFSKTKHAALLDYRTLKAAFNKAVSWEYITDNPLSKIKMPKVPKSKPLFISEKELETILAKENEPILKDAYTFAFYTGLRLGEVCNLQWSDLDFKIKMISVKNKDNFTTKSKKERDVPMTHKIYRILNRQDRNKKYIFARKKDFPISVDFLSKKFKKTVMESGLNPKIHFHTLRHSFASLLIQRGVSIYVVKELLGHQDISTTMIYSHLESENLKTAISKLDK